MPDLGAQAFVERVALDNARCCAAVGDGMRATTGNLANGAYPSSRSIAMISSGELPSAISMRAKCTLTPSGTIFGYQFSTTVLTLGTMTPSRTAPAMALLLVWPRWLILADRSMVAC
jgi:hypothetical protein